MRTIKSMLLISRKRAREVEHNMEEVKRSKMELTGNVVSSKSQAERKKQDEEIDAILAHFNNQMEELQVQVNQLERLERERRRLQSIIKMEKLHILMS